MNNADMPVMPLTEDQIDRSERGNGYEGLTKREEFAKAAMHGLLSFYGDGQEWDLTAREAVACADALLAELEAQS